MKPIIHLLLITALVTTSNAYAQETEADSLWAVWQDQSSTDTSRVGALQAFLYKIPYKSYPDSVIKVAELQLDFARPRDLAEHTCKALYNIGIAYGVKGEFEVALQNLGRSLDIAEKADDQEQVSKILYGFGRINRQMGELHEALVYYDHSLKIAEKFSLRGVVSINLFGIANIYFDQGRYDRALKIYQRKLKTDEKDPNKYYLSGTLNEIGRVYSRVGDFQKALDCYQRSLALYKAIPSQVGIATAYINLGHAYSKLEDRDLAIVYTDSALIVARELNDNMRISLCLGNLAGAYHEHQNDPIKAIQYYQEALKLDSAENRPYRMTLKLLGLGEIYQGLGNHKKAIRYFEKGLTIAKEFEDIDHQKQAYEHLYSAHKELDDLKQALFYHELYLLIEDSLNQQATAKKLQQMEFQNQATADSLQQEEEKLKVEMAHQQEVAQKDKTRDLLFGGGLLMLLMAIGFYGRWRYVKKSKDTISKEKDRSETLLLNILPAEIAEELKEKGEAAAREFDMVSILFTDFKGFTQASEKLSAADLVAEINTCFKAFDGIVGKYNIEKIKTIGDAYMAAGGLPVPDENAAKNTVLAGLEMQAFMKSRKTERDAQGLPAFEMRVGIHTGPVVAGIVGVKKFQYDIWGDTVNTASRMESSGEVGQVNISEATYELVKENSEFIFTSRGKVVAKGKGEMEMYFVQDHTG